MLEESELIDGTHYAANSPLPNWPIPSHITKTHFNKYCTPVNLAIIDGLTRNNKEILLKRFLSSQKTEITKTGMKIIRDVYSEEVDLILMKSGY